MSQDWKPTYDDPIAPAPLWKFVIVLGLVILAVVAVVALSIG